MLKYVPSKSLQSLDSGVGTNTHIRQHQAQLNTSFRPARVGSGLLHNLRESTQLEHRALENQPLLRALLTPELTMAQYSALLQGLFSFYRSLEIALIPAVRAMKARFPTGDYNYQPRSQWLRDDLLSLGRPPVEGSVPKLRDDIGVGATLGVLYVVEGSTQGGRVIAPQIERSLGVTREAGASFFNVHRQSDSWPRFKRWVSDFESDYFSDERYDQTVAVQSACATFSGLHAHLNHWQGKVE